MAENTIEEFEEYLDGCEDPINAWETKLGRIVLTESTSAWVMALADWKNMVTLTFRDEKPFDVAMAYFYKLIRKLNEDVFGKNYTRIVKHSYFTYCLGIEYQKRGVIHFHFITNKPLNFTLIHKFWNEIAGFAWASNVRSTQDSAEYISKYVLKGGQVEAYRANKDYFPRQLPFWWIVKKDIYDDRLGKFEERSGLVV